MNENLLKESFGTLSETINGLIKIGYIHDFNIQEECLVCHQSDGPLSPDDFHIDKVYRFEGASNPEDQSVLYAISSAKHNLKGTLVNGYGISSDEASSKVITKLRTHEEHISSGSKSNDATTQRPEGNRILNAPLVEMNLYQFVDQLKSEKTWAEGDRNSLTIFKSETMRIVLMGLHAKAELKPHKANGVICVQVLEGKINFSAEQQTSLVETGKMIALHQNVTHSVVALTDCFFLLTLAMNSK